jgi:hypothetical protein
VGSGSWHWSVPYEDPDARGPYTVDDLVWDILGDSGARAAVMNVFDKIGASEHFRTMILSERNLPLCQAMIMFPNYDDAIEIMGNALASV